MSTKTQWPPASRSGGQDRMVTGFAGNDGAVCVCEFTTSAVTGSRVKACLVAFLQHLFELSPSLATAFGRAVLLVWPSFRRV